MTKEVVREGHTVVPTTPGKMPYYRNTNTARYPDSDKPAPTSSQRPRVRVDVAELIELDGRTFSDPLLTPATRHDPDAGWVHPSFPGVEFTHAEAHEYAYVGEPRDLFVVSSEFREANPHYRAPGATDGRGPGNRPRAEQDDPNRSRFQVDNDRVVWSESFRLLGDKAQATAYMLNPEVRNRATHSNEVGHVASQIASSVGLEPTLARAAGLGHDIGHSCCGHQGEDALDAFAKDHGLGGFDHAAHGGHLCQEMNLNHETINAVAHHSWKCDTPQTPEASVVAVSDRIAYLPADFDDAVRMGVVNPSDLDPDIRRAAGDSIGSQIDYFIRGVQEGILKTGRVCMAQEQSEVLAAFRRFNYENIYMRPTNVRRAGHIHKMVYSLCEKYARNPSLYTSRQVKPNSPRAAAGAIQAVAALTDYKVVREASSVLGWNTEFLNI